MCAAFPLRCLRANGTRLGCRDGSTARISAQQPRTDRAVRRGVPFVVRYRTMDGAPTEYLHPCQSLDLAPITPSECQLLRTTPALDLTLGGESLFAGRKRLHEEETERLAATGVAPRHASVVRAESRLDVVRVSRVDGPVGTFEHVDVERHHSTGWRPLGGLPTGKRRAVVWVLRSSLRYLRANGTGRWWILPGPAGASVFRTNKQAGL